MIKLSFAVYSDCLVWSGPAGVAYLSPLLLHLGLADSSFYHTAVWEALYKLYRQGRIKFEMSKHRLVHVVSKSMWSMSTGRN
jgi:hypothetical protein